MDYEKKYNDALKRAKAVMDVAANQDEARGIATTIFPELRESEDERIRKELIEQVGYIIPDKEEYDDDGRVLPTYHKRIERYRAWLEKQKEQKSNNPDEIINLKFSVGDVVCRKGWADHTIKELFIGKEPVYICTNDEGLESHIPYSEQDEWELKQKEQKPAEWSEEDENKIESIKGLVTTGRFADTNTIRTIWKLLDSLSPRPSWKPSEEQMNYLCAAVDAAIRKHNESVSGYKPARVLKSLYEDLKKL